MDKRVVISIHAPREGGDDMTFVVERLSSSISIHAPREGGDDHEAFYQYRKSEFQSTPPARGATLLRENATFKV